MILTWDYITISFPSLQSNAAYKDSERIKQEENDNDGHPELTSSLQSNEAYEISTYDLKMVQYKQTVLVFLQCFLVSDVVYVSLYTGIAIDLSHFASSNEATLLHKGLCSRMLI